MKNRYDFLLFFDVQDGNPNGDPDAGNLPRVDPETNQGLVTDVCLKRKVRNYVSIVKDGAPGFEIYIKERAVLTLQQERAYAGLGAAAEQPDGSSAVVVEEGKKSRKRQTHDVDIEDQARDWMCQTYFDVRAFGAVMSLKENPCGQVRGPLQLTFGRSVDPICSTDHSITRMAVATVKEAENQGGQNRTMGRKSTVPYGLYCTHGFVNPMLAEKTGFTDADLEIFWEALLNMFEHDRSAARGLMTTRRLLVFRHNSQLGNARASELFDLVQVSKKGTLPPRGFQDYSVEVRPPPAAITLLDMTS